MSETKKKGRKKPGAKPGENVKHGTRSYHKDKGGPSWDTKQEFPPGTEEIMVLIERRPEDLELFREFLAIFAKDGSLQSLSMTEMIDMAEMAMLQEKIMKWMLAVDSPERMEKMRESNKMLKSIWQIKGKMMERARERAPVGGTFDGISKVLDEVEEDEEDDMESESD